MVEQVAKVAGLDAKVAEHEIIKINNQKVEIGQLKKKNSELGGKKPSIYPNRFQGK